MITCKECGALNSSSKIICGRCELPLRTRLGQFLADRMDKEMRFRLVVSAVVLGGAVFLLILIDLLGI
ncbi:MAG: hypothetical protein JWN25_3370 [Verrucomicrobiales bacterium]|nr:hypothetical protein [Verrucomicrobiales bacterium]MDB6129228.1 hypothetical protein [Verrucomicrobiales bacterium]